MIWFGKYIEVKYQFNNGNTIVTIYHNPFTIAVFEIDVTILVISASLKHHLENKLTEKCLREPSSKLAFKCFSKFCWIPNLLSKMPILQTSFCWGLFLKHEWVSSSLCEHQMLQGADTQHQGLKSMYKVTTVRTQHRTLTTKNHLAPGSNNSTSTAH